MKKVRAAVVTTALGVGLTLSSGAATAETAGTEASVQCTRQYVVTSTTTLRDSPGGNVIVSAWITDKFNVPNPSGVWYEGNLYDTYGKFFGHGYIMASTLDYTGICF
jgi:ABC-type glycerol-3-phosphate transport system substrate-binding protein